MTAISNQQSAFSYSYDAKGDRLKTVREGVTTYYVYDLNGNVLAAADGSKNIASYYIHGQGLIGMITAADVVYSYHYNAIGSTVAMTDTGQNVVNKYSYQPFGKIISKDEAVPQPFKYVGQYGVMAETNGFYYMRARYYDPKVGRFVSEDPIGFKGGDMNLTRYVGNQPVNRIDPIGLAYFAKRPLHGLPWLGKGSCDPGSFDDVYNTEASHEQLFFEDGKDPSNIGFFDDGTYKTEPNPTGYRCRSGHYNDCIMRKAVRNARWQPYSLLGSITDLKYNCQDWADSVREEYKRLAANPKVKCECEK